MNVTGSFIFGFDNQDINTFQETIDMINNKLNIDVACFNILTPFPGTKLFERIKNENRITSYEWARYSCAQTVFKPMNMSEEELYKGTIWVLNEYYRLIPTLKRIIRNTNHGYHPFFNSIFSNALYFVRKFDPGRN